MRSGLLALALLAPLPCAADAKDDFIVSNMLSTFYHEFAHALVDKLSLPVMGREEDAADALSVIMMDWIWDEDSATAIAFDTANAFWGASQDPEAEPAYWDSHSTDMQRYYSTACLFYGGDPDKREKLVAEFELPAERAEGCAFEREQAERAWGPVLAQLTEAGAGASLRFASARKGLVAEAIAAEVDDLNAGLRLPEGAEIKVEVASCGEANAFYDAETSTITMCSEYADYMAELYDSL